MSVSQPMMALFTAPSATMSVPGSSTGPADAASGDAVADFAALLASQDPAKIQAVLDQLGLAEKLAGGGPELAAEGKQLPESIQDWLNQLAALDPDDALAQPIDPQAVERVLQGESDRWFRWLSESRLTLVDPSVEEGESEPVLVEAEAVEEPDQAPLSATIVSLGTVETDMDSSAPEALPGEAVPAAGFTDGRATSGGANPVTAEPAEQGSDDRIAIDDSRRATAKVAAETAQLGQRANPITSAPAESIAFASKLAEQLEAGTKSSSLESESADGMSRPALASQTAAQSALTARPVTAPAQTLGVPFGQQGWGEAMVEKVMWASSQNLRSVEIHLDPAELGPLEIHIQQRGQEQQVQFLSQNASVREALESQMFRLREMFTQQGMNQVNVSVGDSSAGQQSAREQFAGNRGGSGRADDRNGSTMEAGDSILTSTAAARVSSDRLVDYYA